MINIFKKIRDYIHLYRPLPDYYGSQFKRIYAFLKESRHWDRQRIAEYKLERLKELVRHAQANVPFYRELYGKHGINAENIKTFEDFSQLPVLTKKALQNNFEALKADNIKKFDPIPGSTSATSAGATKFLRSAYLEAYRKAVVWRFFNEYGYHFREKRVNITNPINFDPNAPVFEYDKLENELIIDTAHLMALRFEKAYDAILSFKPRLVWAHANMLGPLAEYALRNDLPPVESELVATFAIKFEPHVRRMVEKVFKGRYFEYYGNRENTIAAWGDNSEKFFEVSEYCHLELDTRASCGRENEGDLITTSLHNYAFPLIRYHSEDYAKWLGYTDDDKPYPALKLIGGRGKDLILTPEGLIEPYIFVHAKQQGFDKMQTYQVEQLAIDRLLFRIVPKPEYDPDKDEDAMIKLIKEALPGEFDIEIKYVDAIPPTPQGKFRLAISPLALDYINQYET
ncbi:MAG: hypothetical protein GF310_01655 [candidate division Zixibacteria bacterium]|nr:hypothetical protein [candidate division Zixibacteria bacterium]